MAKVTVTTAGKPSGTTATAILRDTSNKSSKRLKLPVLITPPMTTKATKPKDPLTNTFPN